MKNSNLRRMVKVKRAYEKHEIRGFQNGNPGHTHAHMTRCLPFFKAKQGKYIHRVRSGRVHIWDGKYHHTSIGLWCGQSGFVGGKRGGELMAVPPDGADHCAMCEGRLRGAGEVASNWLAKKRIKYAYKPAAARRLRGRA